MKFFNNMNRGIVSFFCLATVLMLTACMGGSKQSELEIQIITPTVEVVTASYTDVAQQNTYPSNIQAYTVNNVVPQSGGRITKINVEIGDFVKEGQVLAEMERLNLEQSRLRLINDSTELSRLKGLLDEGGISLSDYEAMELSYNVNKSTYQNLLDNTILRSPISGVITARNYDRGDMYAMSSPIYVVQQITPVKMLVAISESEYTRVHKGDKVSITVDAIPGKTFEGSINRIYPIMDASTHTFTAEVVVKNTDKVLRPGMYARVTVTFATNHSIVVPDTAVMKMQGSGQRYVYVLNSDNTVEMKVVEIGEHFDSQYEILSGIEEGDKVVSKGNTSLKNGDLVEVVG